MIKSFAAKFFFRYVVLAAISLTALSTRADVVNGNFDSANSGFVTSYSFIASGTSTSPGTFGVRTNSQDFNPGYDKFTDHSGSGGMMLVDGDANTTVWQETVTVSANSNYVFTVWAAPANSSNPSGLHFFINGVQQGDTLQLTNTPGAWVRFSATWNSGAATSAILSITDDNGVSLGNDFALDDISFVPGITSPVNTVTASIYTAVEINWPSQANQSYQVQYRTNLTSSTWFDLGAPLQGTGTNNSVFDSIRGSSVKFYRVITAQ